MFASNGLSYESIIARRRAKWRELRAKDNQDYYYTAHNRCAPFLSNNAGNGRGNDNDNKPWTVSLYISTVTWKDTGQVIVGNNYQCTRFSFRSVSDIDLCKTGLVLIDQMYLSDLSFVYK